MPSSIGDISDLRKRTREHFSHLPDNEVNLIIEIIDLSFMMGESYGYKKVKELMGVDDNGAKVVFEVNI